jgi:hypothetical protein
MSTNKRISGADDSELITDNSYMAKQTKKNPGKHAHVYQFQQEIKPSQDRTEVLSDIRNNFENSGNHSQNPSHFVKGQNKKPNMQH